MGIIRTHGIGCRLHLVDRIREAIHHHVETHIEEMLMNECVHPGGDQGPVLWNDPIGDGTAVHDPRQLDFVTYRTILVEIPEKAIVVVPHSGKKGEYQAT